MSNWLLREARFQVLGDILRRLPDILADEVQQDVAEAIASVRAASNVTSSS